MKKLNFLERVWYKIKTIIGGVSFNIFLWSSGLTKEKYWKEIQRQENYHDAI